MHERDDSIRERDLESRFTYSSFFFVVLIESLVILLIIQSPSSSLSNRTTYANSALDFSLPDSVILESEGNRVRE